MSVLKTDREGLTACRTAARAGGEVRSAKVLGAAFHPHGAPCWRGEVDEPQMSPSYMYMTMTMMRPGLFLQREGPGSEPGNSLVRPDGHV